MDPKIDNSVIASTANAGAVTLVTGGGTGIGAATAETLARSGAKVAICGRRTEPLAAVRERIEAAGGECHTVLTDVRDPDQVEAMVGDVLGRFGSIDILVNNAGGQFTAPAAEISPKGWRAVHNLNVDAVWSVTRSVAETAMIPARRGVVFFVGFAPRRGIPGFAHACAARAAVENLASTLALEWSRYGIRSIYLAVGSVASEGLEQYGAEHAARMAGLIPLKRLGTPLDVALPIAFLASPAGAYVTGTSIVIDGGLDAWGRGEAPPPLAEDTPPQEEEQG
jgi:citronellol/citronellal dehydrogenase